MEESGRNELVEMLQVVKMQNEKLFEMQEEQTKWNKQHAINLKLILEHLNEMFQTIKALKARSEQRGEHPGGTQRGFEPFGAAPGILDSRGIGTQQGMEQLDMAQSHDPLRTQDPSRPHERVKATSTATCAVTFSAARPATTPLVSPMRTVGLLPRDTGRTPAAVATAVRPAPQRKGTFDVHGGPLAMPAPTKRSRLNGEIEANAHDQERLRAVLLSIDSEEVFDGITRKNVLRLVPCVVNALVACQEPDLAFVALQFVWEMTRKLDDAFEDDQGYTLATQLLHAVRIFSASPLAADADCPLAEDEIVALLRFLQRHCPCSG